MRLVIAIALVFITVAGGLAVVVAVLALIFNLAWEHHHGTAPRPHQPDDDQR